MQAMSVDELARKLPTVLDTLANRGGDILVEKEGVIFLIEIKNTFKETLSQKPDIWADYDPEKARKGLRKSAGALKGVDRDALQRDIQNQRKQDSQGRPT